MIADVCDMYHVLSAVGGPRSSRQHTNACASTRFCSAQLVRKRVFSTTEASDECLVRPCRAVFQCVYDVQAITYSRQGLHLGLQQAADVTQNSTFYAVHCLLEASDRVRYDVDRCFNTG